MRVERHCLLPLRGRDAKGEWARRGQAEVANFQSDGAKWVNSDDDSRTHEDRCEYYLYLN